MSDNLLRSSFKVTRAECIKSQYTQYHYINEDHVVKQTTSRPSSSVGQRRLSKTKFINNIKHTLHTTVPDKELIDALTHINVSNIENIDTNNHTIRSRPVTARPSTSRSNTSHTRPTTAHSARKLTPPNSSDVVPVLSQPTHTLDTFQQFDRGLATHTLNTYNQLQQKFDTLINSLPIAQRSSISSDINDLMSALYTQLCILIEQLNTAQPIAQHATEQIAQYQQQYNTLKQQSDTIQLQQWCNVDTLRHDISELEQQIHNEGMPLQSDCHNRELQQSELYELIRRKLQRSQELCYVYKCKLANIRQLNTVPSKLST